MVTLRTWEHKNFLWKKKPMSTEKKSCKCRRIYLCTKIVRKENVFTVNVCSEAAAASAVAPGMVRSLHSCWKYLSLDHWVREGFFFLGKFSRKGRETVEWNVRVKDKAVGPLGLKGKKRLKKLMKRDDREIQSTSPFSVFLTISSIKGQEELLWANQLFVCVRI